MRRCGATRATCPRSRCRRRLQISNDLDAALRARARRPGDRGDADGRRSRRCSRAPVPSRTSRMLWLCKGFQEAHRLARPRGRARGGAGGARRRAVGPELRASRWRAASRRRWSRPAATPALSRGRRRRAAGGAACASTPRPIRSASRSAARSRTCWRSPPASPTAWRSALNARAALITRGLAEMTRLGVALGAAAETFMGLSGLGDLVLTATGDLSRNRRVGLLLPQARRSPRSCAELGHVAEGVLQRADGAAAGARPRRRDADHRGGRGGARRPARARARRSSS